MKSARCCLMCRKALKGGYPYCRACQRQVVRAGDQITGWRAIAPMGIAKVEVYYYTTDKTAIVDLIKSSSYLTYNQMERDTMKRFADVVKMRPIWRQAYRDYTRRM